MAEQVTYWRVGSKVHRTLYRGDELVGMVDTPALALEVISALNSRGRSLVQVAADSIEAFADRLGLEHFADRPDADRDEQLVAQGMRQAVEIMRRIAERESGRERSPEPPVAVRAVCGACLSREDVGADGRFEVHVNSSGQPCSGSRRVAP